MIDSEQEREKKTLDLLRRYYHSLIVIVVICTLFNTCFIFLAYRSASEILTNAIEAVTDAGQIETNILAIDALTKTKESMEHQVKIYKKLAELLEQMKKKQGTQGKGKREYSPKKKMSSTTDTPGSKVKNSQAKGGAGS